MTSEPVENEILKFLDFQPELPCEIVVDCTNVSSYRFKMRCCGSLYLACTGHMILAVKNTRNIIATGRGLYCTRCGTPFMDQDPWFVTHIDEFED